MDCLACLLNVALLSKQSTIIENNDDDDDDDNNDVPIEKNNSSTMLLDVKPLTSSSSSSLLLQPTSNSGTNYSCLNLLVSSSFYSRIRRIKTENFNCQIYENQTFDRSFNSKQ
jgi:hypothetical protein